MTQNHIATVQPLPSSILHNSAEVRRQYTRAAAKQAVQFISRKVRVFNRRTAEMTQDMTQIQGGH
ncbi:hypothetical protein MSNKSG1_09818 [Marinobacter santoriniensis NKSG1]|uniref:Uncharacterized protein n=1 Tax=Marinobacter santoriniensis NKSG1 TaxID=1288826 RepID=M7CR94_9GAMM|nr:hypothetical protein [Marinobacter santoriniensis]EMP56161.1 hypothetical protein MSNKSG1_09818 [Marinobacter santoriniensis NKSG1]